MEPRHWTALEIIGATTAGKLQGTSRGVNTDRSTSFSSSRPSQSPVISRPRFTHSVPYSSFLLHLSSARRSGHISTLPSEPKTASCKSCGGDRTHLVPVISRIGGDASHGAAAPMLVMTQCSSWLRPLCQCSLDTYTHRSSTVTRENSCYCTAVTDRRFTTHPYLAESQSH